MNNLRRVIKFMLSEAGESEKDSKKIKTKDRVVIDVNDDNDTNSKGIAHKRGEDKTTTRKSEQEPGRRAFRGARGGGPSLDSFRGHSVGDSLGAAASSDYQGDFDTDFESAVERALEQPDAEGHGEWEPGFEEQHAEVPRFQTNQPARLDDPGLTGRARRFKDPKAAITKVLMDEFVRPAMSLGQQILPQVYAELGRLMKKNPKAFVEQFGSAVNLLRELENEWFAELLGIQEIPHRFDPPAGEDKDMQKAIMNVMKKYYNAVLGVASDNSDNLKDALNEIRIDVGDEEFSKGFFGALSDTRDVEDAAFGQLMGGLKRLA